MTEIFRVALSGDFRKADNSPVYSDFDLSALRQPGVEMAFLEPSPEIRAEQIEAFDALILLAPRFSRESIHPNGRLGVVARFGVGYDNV
ncbi:MAG TPA: dehydrogenase, partial [Xanthobacteraceae bacterium]|nr:dehydrogenase [Xanthobacteraceae bacterium]